LVKVDFVEQNIHYVLMVLGVFCIFVSYLLYISQQLIKKLMRRMERINTMIQIQSFQLALLAVLLLVVVECSINFDGVNASQAIKDEIPWHYHDRFFLLSCFLVFIAIFSFVASYYEVAIMFQLDSLLCLIGSVACIILLVITSVASKSITEQLNGTMGQETAVYDEGKCVFMLPQFSQEQLMDHGCTGKYLSFSESASDLNCKKAEIARIWEDNEDILVQDQKESFGCLNLECCNQVESIVKGRFAMVQVGCIVMTFFLILYLMNL